MCIALQAVEHVTWQIIHQGCGYRACYGICSVIYRFHCNEIATLKARCDVKLWCSPKCAPVVVSCVFFLSVNELLLTKCLLCFCFFFSLFILNVHLTNWLCTVMRWCTAQWKGWCLPFVSWTPFAKPEVQQCDVWLLLASARIPRLHFIFILLQLKFWKQCDEEKCGAANGLI